MNKHIYLLLASIFFAISAQSQINPHAIGLRLGGGSFFLGEVSYQQGIGKVNRIELGLGLGSRDNHGRYYAVGAYQWDWQISPSFNWYVGPAVSVGLFSADSQNYFGVGIGGQIGIEYDFSSKEVPILVSLDTRPMSEFVGGESSFGWGLVLGVRYVW